MYELYKTLRRGSKNERKCENVFGSLSLFCGYTTSLNKYTKLRLKIDPANERGSVYVVGKFVFKQSPPSSIKPNSRLKVVG